MTPRKTAAWASLCVACVSSAEGLREYAYRDPVGIPTICFGETRNVKLGDYKPADECRALLAGRLQEFSDGVDSCVRVPLSDGRRAGLVSFAYNVGTGAFCRSGLVRKLNAGDPKACDELLKWTYAGPVQMPGLVKRRQAERALCLEGM